MAAKLEDYRNEANNDPVWRERLAQYSWASGETAAVTKSIISNGILKTHIVVASNATNGITFTVAIIDEDGYTLKSTDSIAENATTTTASLDVPVPRGSQVKITPSGDPGASGVTVDLILYGI